MEEKYMWYWLSQLKSKEVTCLNKLLEYYKTPYNIFITKECEYRSLITDREYDIIKSSKDYNSIVESYNQMEQLGIKYVSCNEEKYPGRLKNIPDRPFGLFYKGRLPDEENISIAIIGARRATIYGREMAAMFARELSHAGVNIISGLATGIDGCAHRGALESKGYTAGVLGGGIETRYPRDNYRLYLEMEKQGGIISEYCIGTIPMPRLFPIRNRIISGLSDGVLVVEAKEKSGSLITVDQGLEQGKIIYAIPGKITDDLSKGCNYIIRNGATLVLEPMQILEDFKYALQGYKQIEFFQCEKSQNKNSLANEEKIVYSMLRLEPKHIDEIIREGNMSVQEILNILYSLENKGLIKQVIKNHYIISV